MGKIFKIFNSTIFRRLAAGLAAFVVLTILGPVTAFAAGKLEVKVHFPFDSAQILSDYMDNADAFARLDDLVEERGVEGIDSLVVIAYSSPEGNSVYNLHLAERRAAALSSYIVSRWPGLETKVILRPEGESWDDLHEAVKTDTRISERTRSLMLDIIESDASEDAKERRLGAFPSWRILYKPHLKRSRFATVTFDPYRMPFELDTDIFIPDEPLYLPLDERLELDDPAMVVPYIKWPLFALSTNLLYDLSGTPKYPTFSPNFSIEVPVGQKWSIWGEYTFPWWLASDNDRAWEILKWDIGVRRWLSHHNPADRMDALTGHFVGIDLCAGYYDIEPGHKGYQGEFQLAGLEYGYAWRLSQRWRLTAAVGAGWMGTHYRYYVGDASDEHLIYQYNGRYTWFGPTKAELSIKYLFTKTKKTVKTHKK